MSSLTGDVAELVCSVRGKPTPEVHWRKAGERKQKAMLEVVKTISMMLTKYAANCNYYKTALTQFQLNPVIRQRKRNHHHHGKELLMPRFSEF